MLGRPNSAGSDERLDARVPLVLPAQISLAGAPPIPCSVVDLSMGGAGLLYPGEGPPSEVVGRLHIDGFGLFDGITVRDAGDSRGLRFLNGEAKRLNLIGKLTTYIEEGLGEGEGEDHTINYESTLRICRPHGQEERCEIACITLQGVVLMTELRPPLGELVRVGRLYGRIARHFPEAIGVEFIRFVDKSASADLAGLS